MRIAVLVSAAILAAVVLMTERPSLSAARSSSAAEARAPRRDEDRSLKLDLISRLRTAPEIVVLGSSRSRRAQPSYIRTLTGRSAFNAGVRGGTAADAWVMTRYLADCRPREKRRYLWFVDAGVATGWVNPALAADPRSHRYIEPASGASPPVDCNPRAPASTRHNPDGSYTRAVASGLPEHSPTLDAQVAKLAAGITCPAASGATSPTRYVWFEKALAFMNDQGARPVIVFNPIHPKVLARLRGCGFPARRASAAYLRGLHARFDFVVVDAEDIRRWGGSADGFWDPTHINYANMRRLLAYVVAHSGGALR